MDLPFPVTDPASSINIYTVTGESAAALEAKLNRLVAALAASAPNPLWFIQGFSLGAAGDGGVFEATVTTTLENAANPDVQCDVRDAKFYVQDAGTGDDSLGVSIVATADAMTAGTRLQKRIFQAQPNGDIFGTRAAGCNAGRRLAVMALARTASPS